jgi:hypothetical protein
MTSVGPNNQGLKQTRGMFVSLTTIPVSQQFSIAAGSGAGGSWAPGAVTSPAAWSTISSATALKDLGKTVVSSTRTFRKVQALIANGPTTSTTGAGAQPVFGLPFYIELNTGQNLSANAANVAYLPGLM